LAFGFGSGGFGRTGGGIGALLTSFGNELDVEELAAPGGELGLTDCSYFGGWLSISRGVS
jgi:hypothetical protein